MTQPNIQIITKPGGLSGAAHAVHILICVFTCGLWIPGYLLFIAFAPKQRIEILAPVGTDPQLVALARANAENPPRQYPPPKLEPANPTGWRRLPPLARAAIIVGGAVAAVYGLFYALNLAFGGKGWF